MKQKIFGFLNKLTYDIYWYIHQKYLGYNYKYKHGIK